MTHNDSVKRMRCILREIDRLAPQRDADRYRLGELYPDERLTDEFIAAHSSAGRQILALEAEEDRIAREIRQGDELLPGESGADRDTSRH